MSSLVIRDWRAETKPVDSDGNFVLIIGRNGGLLAWLLSLIGVDPTTRLLVGMDRVEFTTSSLSGTETRLIPLECICSTYYGYHKPWKAVGKAKWCTDSMPNNFRSLVNVLS